MKMDLALSKSFTLFLFLTIFTVFAHEDISMLPETLAAGTISPHYVAITPAEPPAHHHHHHHPPTHSPTPTPTPTPTHLPVHPPSQPPSHHHHHQHIHGHGHVPSHPPSPIYSPPHHLPSHPPALPPTHAPGPRHHPLLPPSHSPAPSYLPKPRLPRSFISVQGVVYCKSCKYSGVDTLLGATPVPGATVKLVCQNTKYPLVQTVTTDKNGYFFIRASKAITTYAFHKCKVMLVSSPLASCKKPSDLHGGINGAVLRPQKAYVDDASKLPFVLYAVGPFAFEPTCPR